MFCSLEICLFLVLRRRRRIKSHFQGGDHEIAQSLSRSGYWQSDVSNRYSSQSKFWTCERLSTLDTVMRVRISIGALRDFYGQSMGVRVRCVRSQKTRIDLVRSSYSKYTAPFSAG